MYSRKGMNSGAQLAASDTFLPWGFCGPPIAWQHVSGRLSLWNLTGEQENPIATAHPGHWQLAGQCPLRGLDAQKPRNREATVS